jgi:alkaline phosphatase D
MKRYSKLFLIGLIGGMTGVVSADAEPFQATGFKVGEVTDQSAIVWTRLTARERANPADGPMVEFETGGSGKGKGKAVTGVRYPEGMSVSDIRNAVPGREGETRVRYRHEGGGDWLETDWAAVDATADYTKHFVLSGLKAGARYEVQVESRGVDGVPGQVLEGGFVMAPEEDVAERVSFVVTTGQRFPDKDNEDGFDAYAGMLTLDPSFFVHTGDIVYYDKLAKTVPLAHYHWQRTYGLPSNVAFHRQVGSYFIKDDHDAWANDSWPSMETKAMFEFTFEDGLRIFREQVPMSEKTYRTFRWGKDLQVWLVEGRDFRSANTMPDGPGKTIWGEEQMEWFKRTVSESDATFRVLISPTPIVGPDRDNKADNHANSNFAHEGDQVRAFIASQDSMFVVCGDRHWQYYSVHPGTGVREYSCGPTSDAHAGGWEQEDYRDDYHRYLNVRGGFLSVTVEREGKAAAIGFRFHDPAGKVLYEDLIETED